MARLGNYLIFMAMSMVIGTTIASITAPDKEETLLECATHIGSHCGNQILNSLQNNTNTNITNECCYKIIQTGYSCHTRLTLHILQNDRDFKHANVSKVLAKNDGIFQKCDKATEPKSDRYLSKCVVKIGTDCGEEVFDNLVNNNKKVSGCCCDRLVETGLTCHINMAKALLRTPKLRDVDAIQFLNKSTKIFNECREG